MLRLANASRSAATGPSLRGLDWLNFFIADFQTGFGPFISVYLTGVGWTQGAIGAALSIGTVAGMASQVPGGVVAGMVREYRHPGMNRPRKNTTPNSITPNSGATPWTRDAAVCTSANTMQASAMP